jgi:hypothetical protein
MGIVLEMVGELEKENSEWLFLIKCWEQSSPLPKCGKDLQQPALKYC